MEHDGRRRVVLLVSLGLSLASIAVTVAIGLVTVSQDVSRETIAKSAHIVIAICVLGWLALLLIAFATGVREERFRIQEQREALAEEHAALSTDRALLSSVPSVLRFTARHDTLTIDRDGSGTLRWRFSLASPDGDHVPTLHFPIFVETRPGEETSDRVTILRAAVNHQEIDNPSTLYRVRERRISMDGELDVEYGTVSIPASLGRGSTVSEMELEMRFDGVWSKAVVDHDSFFVDIPYLTERLQLEICGNGCVPRLPTDTDQTPAIIASSLVMDVWDLNEAIDQSTAYVEAEGGRLVWSSSKLKLGYRYRVRFHVEK